MTRKRSSRRSHRRSRPKFPAIVIVSASAAIAGIVGGLLSVDGTDRLSRLSGAISGFLAPGGAANTQTGDLVGTVTRVRDGDTIEIEGQAVRLNGLHAPEMSDPGGRDARRFMVNFVEGRTVVCNLNGEQSFDRLIGRCFFGGRDIAIPLIQAGLGRDCPRYSGGRYRQYETAASRRWELPGYC